jgi:DNA-binding MarR family transcriptional regulator
MKSDASRGQPLANEDDDLGARVRSAVGLLYRRFRSERPEGTLGDKALDVLTWLHKRGAQTLTELSDQDRVTPASMSQTLNRLTSAGYVIRTRDSLDRRKVFFSTTSEGAAVADAAVTKRNVWLDTHLDALSAEDRRAIARASAILSEIAAS